MFANITKISLPLSVQVQKRSEIPLSTIVVYHFAQNWEENYREKLYSRAIIDVFNSVNMTAVLDDFLLNAENGRSGAKCGVNKYVNVLKVMLQVMCSALCSFMHVMDMKTSSPILIRIERNFNVKSVHIPINDNDLFSIVQRCIFHKCFTSWNALDAGFRWRSHSSVTGICGRKAL